jgi:putative ABC transport system permease protein
VRKNPGFAAVAVLTLAFGIGANTAIFSIVDGVVLRQLSYKDASRLVAIHERVRMLPFAPALPVNAMHFRAWGETARSFDQLALVGMVNLNLTDSGEPERLAVARASWNLFSMLGVQAQLGRTFVEAEDRADYDRVVVLSDSLWRRRFAADPRIVGQRIMLDDQPFEVVGVLPAGFRFPTLNHLFVISVAAAEPQLWKPFGLRDGERATHGDYNYACIGRLRTGTTIEQAGAELNAVQAQLERDITERPGLSALVVPLRDQVTSRARTGLWLLLAAAGLVLLIACVNVTNLLLGRASARRRELSVRLALGATRGRLIQQLLAESIVLGGAAACLGIAMSYAALGVITARAPLDLPRVGDIHLDGRVLLFTLAASIATTIGVGLVPAWRVTAGHHDHGLRMTAGRATLTFRSLLVAAEIGLSAICLVAAGLLLYSFAKLMKVEKGFDTQHVLTVEVSQSPRRHPTPASADAFIQSVIDRVSSLPGVTSVGVAGQLPLGGVGGNNQLIPDDLPDNRPIVDVRPVNPGYFKALGVGLRAGRLFDESDQRSVAVVSASAAARAWPGQNPIGKRFRLGTVDRPPMEVIGTVGDVLGVSLSDAPSATVYFPYWLRPFIRNRFSLAIKTAGEPTAVAAAVRTAIHELDRELPVPPFRTMDDVVDDSTASRRFQTALILMFAVSALFLASLGTYGVISYSVAQRTKEIGIRLALGAARGRVIRDVLVDAVRLVGMGLAVGVPFAVATGYGLRSLLFGVVPHDARVVGVVCLTLTATAILAALVPARRASRVDPVVALRQE